MSQKLTRRDFLKASPLFSAGTVLAACKPAETKTEEVPSENPPSAEKTKLIFSSYTWAGYQAAMQTALDQYVAKNPNVEIEGQFVADGYWDKVQTQVAAGEGLDCGIGDYGRLVSYSKNGTLLDITNYMQSSNFPINKAFPGASSQYRWV